MANDYNSKRFYWIKLRENFMTSDAVDFLMGQKEGANYVVLYQMLCLKTANTGGELSRTIGEMIIPYDVDKITRDVKWFSKDTVIVALELYKKLGLVFANENGNLVISNYDKMVGSETQSAIYKQDKKQLENFQLNSNRYKDIKILDNKSIEIELDKEINNNKPKKSKYGEYKNVLLTEEELQSLKSSYTNYLSLIKYLDEYIEMKGYKAKSHYLCIKKWVIDAVGKQPTKPEWFDKEIKKEVMSDEELEKMKDLLKEYQ